MTWLKLCSNVIMDENYELLLWKCSAPSCTIEISVCVCVYVCVCVCVCVYLCVGFSYSMYVYTYVCMYVQGLEL